MRIVSLAPFRRTLARIGLALLLASSALPQQNFGTISGVVTDPNGAAVPGVKILASNDATGLKTETISTEAGLYVFGALPVGNYSITAEKTGFKRLTQPIVQVLVSQRVSLDLRLELGDVQQTVEVTAEAPLLETTTSERGQNLAPTLMSSLPLFTGGLRRADSFVAYMPGVNSWRETSIGGSGGRAQEVLIDGASLTIPESGGVVFNFTGVEPFGEFKLVTSTYSAELGRFGGGVQVYSTKSGTNNIHGAGFWYLRRDIFNANAWAQNASGRARPKERFNEAGFAVGGPVYIPKVYNGRNKTFFYLTYTRDLRPASIAPTLTSIPTVRMKRGDFSEVSQAVYDPATTSGNTRTPFAGNLIPSSRISRISNAFVGVVPDSNLPGLNNNLSFINTSKVTDNVWSLKFDHNFTPNNRIAYFQSTQDQNIDNVTALPGPLGQGLGGNSQRPVNYRVNHDWTAKPTFLVHTTFGYSRTRQGWDNPLQSGFASKAGLAVPTDATPRVRFAGADALAPWGVQDGKVDNGKQWNTTYHFNQSYSWIRGRHEFKFGGDLRRLQTIGDDKAGTNGLFQFERAQTALPTATGTTGHSFASFLLGAPNQVEFTTLPIPNPQIRYGYHAGYFQDNWKVSSRLSLNLGVRYEVPIGFHMQNYQFSFVDLTKPNPGANNLPGAMAFAGPGAGRTGTKRPYPTDFSNFGPRAGFAYQLASKTVLRGGFGIYYQTLGNGGCGCTLGFAGPPGTILSNGVAPALLWDGGVPIPQGAKPPFIDPTFGNFQSVDYLGQDFGKAPRIYNWSFNIQHEVKGFLFDIAYVGNQGRGLASTLMLNQVDPKYLSLGALLRQPITSQEVRDRGFRKPFDSFPDTQTLAQALRPYPQFFNVNDRNSGDGKTWYDSLQFTVNRRYGFWTTSTNYTFSKAQTFLHYRQIFSQTQTQAQNNYDLSDNKTLSPFDQTHLFNTLNSFDLPFGRGKKWMSGVGRAADLAVGGWSVSFIGRYTSGGPLDVAAPNTLGNALFTLFKKANTTGTPIRAGIDAGTLDPNNPNVRWFNCRPEAVPGRAGAFQCAAGSTPFSIPGEFEFGSASQFISAFRGPAIFSENLSIAKRFGILRSGDEDRLHFTYRADFFNLFNRTRFGVNGAIGNPDFGKATGPQVGARFITMGLRLEF